jgi:hypothetical protein
MYTGTQYLRNCIYVQEGRVKWLGIRIDNKEQSSSSIWLVWKCVCVYACVCVRVVCACVCVFVCLCVCRAAPELSLVNTLCKRFYCLLRTSAFTVLILPTPSVTPLGKIKSHFICYKRRIQQVMILLWTAYLRALNQQCISRNRVIFIY